jgi:hypothetical protein
MITRFAAVSRRLRLGIEGRRMFQSTPVTGRQHTEEVTPLPRSIIPLMGEGFQPELVFDEADYYK